MNIREFAKSFNNSTMPLIDYVEQLPQGKLLYTQELLAEIQQAIQEENSSYLEVLLLMSLRDGVDDRYTKILCRLLTENWHESQEDIVMLLEDIKDPNSIESLYNAAIDIPGFDDGRSLAKKCIWALGAIGTQEAKIKLQLLSNNSDLIIKEFAIRELQHVDKL